MKPAADASVWKHLDGVERIVVEVSAHQSQLLENVVGDGDDVTADCVGLEDVRAAPWGWPRSAPRPVLV